MAKMWTSRVLIVAAAPPAHEKVRLRTNEQGVSVCMTIVTVSAKVFLA